MRQKLITLVCILLCGNQLFAAQSLRLTCETESCAECALIVDLSSQVVEYMDNESSHILKQTAKTESARIFRAEPSVKIPAPGYKVKFDRKKKTATLSQFSDKKSEKVLFESVVCK